MNTKNIVKIVLLLAGLNLSSGVGAASYKEGDLIFERVSSVIGEDSYLQQIKLDKATNYSLTLTDFAFPDQLSNFGVTLVSASGVEASIVFDNQVTLPTNFKRSHRFNPYGSRYSVNDDSLFSSPDSFAPPEVSAHSWGLGKKQKSVGGYLEAGTYYLAMYADFDQTWALSASGKVGLYGVEMIATPIPASIFLLSSGLGLFGFISRKRLTV